MNNLDIFFTGHALRRITLEPYLVYDLLRFERVHQAGPAKEGRSMCCFWNPLTRKFETLILCPNNRLVITMFQRRPDSLRNYDVEHLKMVAQKPFYLHEFSAEVNSKKFCVTISAQNPRPGKKQPKPQLHKASFDFKARSKSSVIGQILQNRDLHEAVKNQCQRRLGTLVPLRLEIDGVDLPLSTVLGKREERIHFPWAYTPYHNLVTA
jgi:hypothetical protein